ncbi:MAG: glycosyltransferase family 4 protein [Candidatus Micrarchaeia archaeon]
MKIAFAYESAYPWFNGGIEKRRYNILKVLAKQKGYELHMFTLYRPGMPGYEFEHEGVKYHCVGRAKEITSMYAGSRRAISMSVKFSALLFLKMLKYHFDAVDTDAFPFLHIPLISVYSRLTGARCIVTWHEVWSKDFWKSYMPSGGAIGYAVERWVSRLADFNIANSSTTKRLLERLFKVKPSDILVFPAAVDKSEIDEFLHTNAGKCKKSDKFVVVNRLVAHKRVELAIKSIAKVDAKLVVVGEGPELAKLKSLAASLGVSDRVVFKHGLSNNALYRELCTSKGLIMPSQREGLSLVTVEALALGIPVIIANTSVLPTELKKLCLKAEESKLPELLNSVLRNYPSYAKKYEAIRPKVISQFSNDRAAAAYDKVLK